MNRILTIVFALVLLATPGCVCQAVKAQVTRSAAAHDVYAELVEATFDGTIKEADGLAVTGEELAAASPSIRTLLTNLIRAVYLSRKGWHQVNFAIGDGPDPATLDLLPPALPGGGR